MQENQDNQENQENHPQSFMEETAVPMSEPIPQPMPPVIAQPILSAGDAPKGEKRHISRRTILVIVMALLMAVAGLMIIFLKKDSGNPTEAADTSRVYSLARDPETGERALFGSDESKDNSPEAFLDYQLRIIAAEDSTPEEVFNAKLGSAAYYIAAGEFGEVEAILNSIGRDNLTTDQTNLLNRMYDSLEVEKQKMAD